MRYLRLSLAGLLLVIAGVVWPQQPQEWVSITPSQAGFDAAKLEKWRSTLEGHRTTGLLVVRHGRIALEWYAHGWDAGQAARHGLHGQGPGRRHVAGGGDERRADFAG